MYPRLIQYIVSPTSLNTYSPGSSIFHIGTDLTGFVEHRSGRSGRAVLFATLCEYRPRSLCSLVPALLSRATGSMKYDITRDKTCHKPIGQQHNPSKTVVTRSIYIVQEPGNAL